MSHYILQHEEMPMVVDCSCLLSSPLCIRDIWSNIPCVDPSFRWYLCIYSYYPTISRVDKSILANVANKWVQLHGSIGFVEDLCIHVQFCGLSGIYFTGSTHSRHSWWVSGSFRRQEFLSLSYMRVEASVPGWLSAENCTVTTSWCVTLSKHNHTSVSL